MKSLTRVAHEGARSFKELSPRAIFVLGLVSILFIGAADFGTPGEMSFTLFYVIVCALAGWRAGRQSAAVLCLFALAMIVVHDVTSIPIRKIHPWILAWNLSTRITVVSVSTWLAAEVSRLTRSLSNLIEERTTLWQTEVKQQAWILENMGEALIMTDAAGKIEMLNPAAERLMGYSAAELNGQFITLLSPFSEQQTPEKFRSLQETLDQQPQWEGELPIRRKDGQVLITQVNVTRLQHNHRNMVIALYQDVTKQREAEAQLRAREERLQLGLQAGRMITWEADLASGTISYSQSVSGFFGGEDLQPYRTLESFAQQVHPDDREAFDQRLRKVIVDGGSAEHEYRIRHADGNYHWVLTKGQGISDASRKAVRLRGVSLDITERKQAEAALRENEALLRAFFDSPGAFRGILELVDNDAIFISANAIQAAALGHTPESIRGARASEINPSGTLLHLTTEKAKEIPTPNATVTFEYSVPFYTPPRWEQATVTRLGAASNGHARLAYITFDITERKQTEELLRQQAQILEQTHDSIVASDLDGRIIYSNKGTERLLGYEAHELVGKHISLLHFEEDMPRLREMVIGPVMNEGQHEVEIRTKRKTGEQVDILLCLSRLRDASGEVRGIIGSAVDISERKKAEQQLALSQSQLVAAMDLAGLANWEYDFVAGCYCFDDRFYALYGTTADREGGNQMTPQVYASEFMFPEDDYMVFQGLASASATNDPNWSVHLEHRIRRRDGQLRHLAVRAAVIKDAAGKTVKLRGVNQDITNRKRAEQQILEISDREQARIGQDLHDGLCQQLVSLAFDANALQRRLTGHGLPEAAAATRLADFLDQAITESRRVSRGLFPIRLEAEGLASALEELARTTHSRFNIQCQFESPHLVSVPDLAVATHLYRIAQEAVNNSIKHGKPKSIAIRLSTADSALELIVEDDGIGLSSAIPESHSGMGLYIMRYRAGSIGATLNFGPGPTGGTVVTCNLKRFPAPSVRQNPVETHFNGEN
jgi:PAS domain S-box-containing protein